MRVQQREGGFARVATVWGRCGGGVEAMLGQCEDGMGVMQGLRLR